jgi:phage gp46-like protein
MFDIATRTTPTPTQTAFTVPFDWRLTAPTQPAPHPWHAFAVSTGQPEHYADMLAVYALNTEDTLQTAVVISLFTDRRARADESLPYGITDRRGWLGAEFVNDDQGDFWGSAFWLLFVTKVNTDILERARFAGQEALAWLVSTGVATKVTVESEWVGDRLAIRPRIYQGALASPVYDVLWGTTLRRGAV